MLKCASKVLFHGKNNTGVRAVQAHSNRPTIPIGDFSLLIIPLPLYLPIKKRAQPNFFEPSAAKAIPLHYWQHRTIPALRLKHRFGGCGTASVLPKCSIMSGCGTRIVLRGQKPLALCDRCPCFGSLFPPLAALTFAASSIICAFGLASAAPRSPYRHLELCGIALTPPS